MNDLEWIRKHGTTAKGKSDYLAYRDTRKTLTPRKAILANCYQCTGYYTDGKQDCNIEDCPLYPYMPYREKKEKVKRDRSEKQLQHVRRLALLRTGGPRI